MRSRPGFIPFIVLVPLLVLALQVALWVRGCVRHTLAHVPQILEAQASAYLGREVKIGAIKGDVWHGIILENIAIARDKKLADGALLRIRRVRLEYPLQAILYGKEPPLESIRRVEIDDPWVYVRRDSRGHLNLQDLVKPSPEKRRPQRFLAVAVVHNGTVVFEDHRVPAGGTITHHITGIEATVDGRAAPLYAASLRARGDAGRLSALSVAATVNPDQKNASATVRAEGVGLPAWLPYKPASVKLPAKVEAGTVDADVTALVMDGKLSDYHARVALRDGAVRVPQLGQPVTDITALLDVAGDTLFADNLRCRAGGIELAGSATVVGFKDPQLRARVSATGVRESEVRALVSNLPELPDVRLGRVDNIAVSVAGPLSAPAVQVSADLTSVSRPEGTLTGVHVAGRAELAYGKLIRVRRAHLDEITGQVAGGVVTATAEVDLDGKAPRYQARGALRGVHAEALNLGAFAGDGAPSGRLDADFTVAGQGADAKARARVEIDRPAWKEWRADAVEAFVAYDTGARKLQIGRAQVRMPEGILTASGTVDLNGPLALKVAATGLDVGTLARRLKVDDVAGEAYLNGEVKGTLAAPVFEGDVAAYDLAYGEDHAEMIRGKLTASMGGVQLDDCQAFVLPALVPDLSLRLVDPRAGGDAELRASGTVLGLDLGYIARRLKLNDTYPWAGTIDVEKVEVSGPLDALQVKASLSAHNLQALNHTIDYAEGRVTVDLPDGKVTIAEEDPVTIRMGSDPDPRECSEVQAWGTVADGKLDLRVATPPDRAIRIEDLATLDPNELNVKSRLTISDTHITGSLHDPVVHGATVNVQQLNINGNAFSLGQGEVDMEKGKIRVVGFTLNGVSTLAVGVPPPEKEIYSLDGQIYPTLNLTATVHGAPVGKLLSIARVAQPAPEFRLQGYVNARIKVEEKEPELGKPNQLPQVELQFVEVNGGSIGQQALRVFRADGLALENGVLTLKKLHAETPQNSTLDATGKLALMGNGDCDLELHLRDLDLAGAGAWPGVKLPNDFPALHGVARVDATIRGTRDHPTVEDGKIVVEKPGIGAQPPLDSLTADITVHDKIEVQDVVARWGEYAATGSASIPFDWEKWTIHQDGHLAGHFAMQEQSLDALALFAPRVVKSKGTFSVLLDVAGTPAEPDLQGQVLIKASEVVIGNREPGRKVEEAMTLRDIDGLLKFNQNKLVVDHLTLASLDRKKKLHPKALQLTGQIALKKFLPDQFDLALVADDFRVDERNLSGGIQERVDATLRGKGTITGHWPQPLVGGAFALCNVKVDATHYQLPPASSETPVYPVNPHFAVRLATFGSAEVLVSSARAFVALESSLGGSLQQYRLAGSARVTRGTVALPTATFRFSPSEVEFAVAASEPPKAEGKATLTTSLRGTAGASTTPQTYQVTMNVDINYPQDPPYKVTFRSSPFLAESDIASMLVRPDLVASLASGGGSGMEEKVKALAIEAFKNSLFQPRVLEPVSDAIRSALGLEVHFDLSLDTPVQIQLEKYLTKNLHVSYTRSVNARETQFKVKVDYDLLRQLSLSWSTDEQQQQSLGLETNFRF